MMSEEEFMTGLKKLMDWKEGGWASAELKWLSLQNVWCQKTKYMQKSSSASAYTSYPSICEGFILNGHCILLTWSCICALLGQTIASSCLSLFLPSSITAPFKLMQGIWTTGTLQNKTNVELKFMKSSPWSMQAVNPASRVRHLSVCHDKPLRSLTFQNQKGSRGFSLHVCCALRPW